VVNFQAKLPCDGGELCSDKDNVSTHENKMMCSSAAVNGMSSNSKEHAATAPRHRKTATDTVAKPGRVLVKHRMKKVKSSVKGRSQPAMSPPQSGDMLPVEIIFTRSSVDIMWQVSSIYSHFESLV